MRVWPNVKGRDGERTPMQWSDEPNAGFTTDKPWLPIPDSYHTHNVATELNDPNSILQFYEHLLAMRHQDAALDEGNYVAIDQNDSNVLSYLRRYGNEEVLVALNMSGSEQKVTFDLTPGGFSMRSLRTLLSTSKSAAGEVSISSITLEPFEVYIGQLRK